jgi:hypothetical protein
MSETLVTIGRYLDVTEAHIAVGLLRSEGIPVHPLDVNHLSANPLLGIGLGGVRLQVPASLEREAREILANHESPNEVELDYLATGKRFHRDEPSSDRVVFGLVRFSDRVTRKGSWTSFLVFGAVFFAFMFLLIWVSS